MTDLISLAGQIAPYLTAVAATMGQAVVDSAQTRLADGVVERGRGFLARALRRDAAEPGPGPEEPAEVAGLVDGLAPAERAALERAVGHWLLDRDGALSESALRTHIVREAELVRQGPVTNTAHATGPGAVAIGQHVGDLHAGYRPGSEGAGG